MQNFYQNSRQMPSQKSITSNKLYCDQLYAWLQLHSERYSKRQRRIAKKEVKWSKIERDFTRFDPVEDKEVITLGRRTIPKYFKMLIDNDLIYEDKEYYYLAVLEQGEGYLIEFNTLQKLQNTMKRNSINVYIYLLNRYFANGNEPFVATMSQIKEYIGHSTATTSNNLIISDILDILRRLGLLRYELVQEEDKRYYQFFEVKNKLPD